jgi:uncharacterized membrane protein/RNA polymerase subunit RPABC4/transcription elongation factor Spt4
MSEEKYCISCGETILPNAELCPECGVRQEVRNLSSDQKHCTHCGEKVDIKAEMCPSCGAENPDPGFRSGATNTELDFEENVAGALAYILGILSGIYFYVTEEENEFVRFHAMQSIAFSLVAFVGVWIINTVVFSLILSPRALATGGFGIFRILSLFSTLLWLAVIGSWAFLMFKAYNNEMYKLPVLGDFAEQNT